jgi:hypothetical protein
MKILAWIRASLLLVCKLSGEFAAADGVDAGFERGDAEEAPFSVADGLDKRLFRVGGGLILGEVAVEMLLVDGGIVGGEKNGSAR